MFDLINFIKILTDNIAVIDKCLPELPYEFRIAFPKYMSTCTAILAYQTYHF
jgi:hypothetical protein